jgi:hypothetical protein
MVRANRWSMAEAVLRPRDVFRAAESDGPQLVVDASGTFVHHNLQGQSRH